MGMIGPIIAIAPGSIPVAGGPIINIPTSSSSNQSLPQQPTIINTTDTADIKPHGKAVPIMSSSIPDPSLFRQILPKNNEGKQPDPKLSSSDPMMKEIDQKQQKVSKHAFVPLQVSRKAVKPVEKKVEEVKPEVAAVKNEVPEKVVTPSPRSSASKENTPQRSLSKGQSAPPKQGRKMRMAANFGGGEGN